MQGRRGKQRAVCSSARLRQLLTAVAQKQLISTTGGGSQRPLSESPQETKASVALVGARGLCARSRCVAAPVAKDCRTKTTWCRVSGATRVCICALGLCVLMRCTMSTVARERERVFVLLNRYVCYCVLYFIFVIIISFSHHNIFTSHIHITTNITTIQMYELIKIKEKEKEREGESCGAVNPVDDLAGAGVEFRAANSTQDGVSLLKVCRRGLRRIARHLLVKIVSSQPLRSKRMISSTAARGRQSPSSLPRSRRPPERHAELMKSAPQRCATTLLWLASLFLYYISRLDMLT